MPDPAVPTKAAPTVPKGRVPVVLPDGTPGTVAASEAPAVAGSGQIVDEATYARLATQARREKELGGAGGMATAAAAGIARGATFGLSDPLIVAAGGSETAQNRIREALKGYSEVNPVSSGAGEAAGIIGTSLLIPGGGIGGLAERGAAAVVGRGAETLGARALQRGIAMGAAGALEGAAYGAGGVVSEAAIQNHELTAEKLLVGARDGAMMGGLFGGALGAGGELFSSAGAGIKRALKPAIGQAGEDVAEKGAGTFYARLAAGGDPEKERLLREAWKQGQRGIHAGEDILEGHTRTVSGALDEQLRASQKVDMASFGEAKKLQMKGLVPEENLQAARKATLDEWYKAKQVVTELGELADKGGGSGGVQKLSRQLADFERDMGKLDASQLFSRLDDFKRQVGAQAKFGTSPFGRTHASGEFEKLYHSMRGTLEDEAVWGAAGAAQKEINQATAAMLDKSRKFEGAFATQYGSEAGVPQWVAKPDAVGSYVRNVTDASNDLKSRMFVDRIEGRRNYLDAVERHYKFDDATKSAIAAERKSLDVLEGTIAKASDEAATLNQLRRAQAEEAGRGFGGTFGMVAELYTKPITTAARIGAIQRAAAGVDQKVGRAISSFIGGAASATGNGLTAAAAATPAAAAKWYTRDEYDRTTKAARDHSTQASAHLDKLDRSLGRVSEVAPSVGAHVGMKAQNAASYLAAIAPPVRVDETSLVPTAKRPSQKSLTLDELRYMRAARAVRDPMSILDDMQRGQLSRDAVQAIKAVYPVWYADIKSRVMTEIVDKHDPNVPLDQNKALQLGILFGEPTHFTLDPEFIKSIQASKGDVPAPAQGPAATAPATSAGAYGRLTNPGADALRDQLGVRDPATANIADMR